jgi:hypothetical protein
LLDKLSSAQCASRSGARDRGVIGRELLRQRLSNLLVAAPKHEHAADVVAALGAMQAQDYMSCLWAIGLRMREGTLAAVQRAVSEHAIVRTWPMRGTLHFVAASDVYWLLDLLAPRVIAANAKRHRDLELDAATFRKAEKALTKALEGARHLTRDGVRRVLEAAKLPLDGQRLYHCLWRLAQDKLLCCGVPQGKQQTFTLLPEWVDPPRHKLASEEALAELARRYVTSHGPVTEHDLMRWANITSREAKTGLSGAAASLSSEVSHGVTYWSGHRSLPPSAAARKLFLLPAFDEYIIGYKDRSDVVTTEHAGKIVPGNNGVFRPTIVSDGEVIGTWKATATRRAVRLEPLPFRPWPVREQGRFERAASEYAHFLDRSAAVDR